MGRCGFGLAGGRVVGGAGFLFCFFLSRPPKAEMIMRMSSGHMFFSKSPGPSLAKGNLSSMFVRIFIGVFVFGYDYLQEFSNSQSVPRMYGSMSPFQGDGGHGPPYHILSC